MKQNNTKETSGQLTPRQKRTRKRVMIGRIIFSLFLALYIGVFVYFANYGYGLLMDWLTRLEASQPDVRSQEVFDRLFTEPDWAKLYEMAGEADTQYEGGEAYAQYMHNLVGDQKLTYVETSAGLSNNKKFIVKANGTKVAEFTLKDLAEENADVPEWTLDKVFVFYTRQESLTVFTQPGHTVYINGVALDAQQHLIAVTETVAEEYLPEGLHGYRDMTLRLDGLLVQPEVTILDENGQQMEIIYDPAINLYSEVLPQAEEITQEQIDTVVAAAHAYGKYMIKDLSKANLKNYFSPDGQAFSVIINSERYNDKYKKYEFAEAMISEYYRYSDTLYSVHVDMMMHITRNNGTIKEFHLNSTFFLSPDENGNWLVESMTNVHLQESISMVKLQFQYGDQRIESLWVATDARQITLPSVDGPAGKTFSGWFTKKVSGLDVSYNLVFSPSETGIVILPEDYVLQPMVLYALFQ